MATFGYGIIAVPTGIYTAELAVGLRERRKTQCPAAHWPSTSPTPTIAATTASRSRSP